MNNETRLLIRSFAEDYLKYIYIDNKDFNGPHYPVRIEEIIDGLQGIIVEDLTDFTSDGNIVYAKDVDAHVFEIHIRKISDRQRKRFTLAHELGHLFLHMDFFDESKRAEHREYQDCSFYRQNNNYAEEELQANEFAASFLMPSKEFLKIANENIIYRENAYNVAKIAEHFDVSNLAALTRGRWLGIFKWDNSY